jgi:uncharacterized RDD family membrane protein YckC
MSQRVAAPLWRRSVAALIDGLLVVLPSVPTLIRARKGPRRSPRSLDVLSTVLNAAYQVSAIASTGQTLGQRALGIRVVGQDTGGVPSMSQALVRWTLTAIPDGLSLLTSRPLAPRARYAEAAMGDLAAEVKELRRNHGTDRQGLNEALMALYKDRNANPIHACVPSLLAALPGVLCRCALYAPALRGPLHQGLHDRLARTVVVVLERRRPRPDRLPNG